MISLSRIDNEIKSTRSFTELVEIVTGLLPDLPDAVRVRVVVDAVIEVPEDVVEHLLVLGADAQARDGRRAAVADRALLHHEGVGDGRDDAERAATAGRRPRHRVAGPQYRRQLHSVVAAPHVTDRLPTQSRNPLTQLPTNGCSAIYAYPKFHLRIRPQLLSNRANRQRQRQTENDGQNSRSNFRHQ